MRWEKGLAGLIAVLEELQRRRVPHTLSLALTPTLTPVLTLVLTLTLTLTPTLALTLALTLTLTRRVPHMSVVVGEGPARSELQRRLPQARFLGKLTGEALATAYASSDVFLYPSESEGWGATCLEAQAAGVPVVAYRASGIVEVEP